MAGLPARGKVSRSDRLEICDSYLSPFSRPTFHVNSPVICIGLESRPKVRPCADQIWSGLRQTRPSDSALEISCVIDDQYYWHLLLLLLSERSIEVGATREETRFPTAALIITIPFETEQREEEEKRSSIDEIHLDDPMLFNYLWVWATNLLEL